MKPIQVIFGHGLGDCVNFCSQIPLYSRRGYQVGVFCREDKRVLFKAAGARILPTKDRIERFGWGHCPGFAGRRVANAGEGLHIPGFNKAGYNLSRDPLPDIGPPQELWDEYTNVRVPLLAQVGPGVWAGMGRYLEKMPRPIVLVHTAGTSFRKAKSLSPAITHELLPALLEQGVGTIISLDKEELVERRELPNLHYWQLTWAKHGLRPLLALQALADALVGIDSGPFHLCRLSGLPSLGVFPTPGHHPAKYCLPSDHQALVVPSNELPWFHSQARAMFPIMEEGNLDAAIIAKHTLRLLSEPRYLQQSQRAWDLQLQHWIENLERGPLGTGQSTYRVLARAISERFRTPRIVETNPWLEGGENDVFKSMILARVSLAAGGSLTSLVGPSTQVPPDFLPPGSFGESVHLVKGSTSGFLCKTDCPIDVLVLRQASADLEKARGQCLLEARAAVSKLGRSSLIVIHDISNPNNLDHGWGGLAINWLCKRGWRIMASNTETMLSRTGRTSLARSTLSPK